MARPRRSTRGGIGLLLLASQIFQIGPDRIPPITLITVVLNVVIYMKLIPSLPSVHGACTSNYLVLQKKQWSRLLASSFYHLDDMHLYFNMVSFIWKGLKLERKMKSKKFLLVILMFSVLTQAMMLLVNKVFSETFTSDEYLTTCAAGFSAVLFALKVLATHESDSNVSVMGLPVSVPSRYACWVELILIHLLVPNSSFTGHLSGILVGLLYTHGPLRKVVKGLNYLTSNGGMQANQQQRATYTRQAEASGYQESDESAEVQRAIQESLRTSTFTPTDTSSDSHHFRTQPPTYGWNIPQQQEPHSLYPDISSSMGNGAHPTAPPFDRNDARAGNNPPYPTGFSSFPGPSNSNSPPYPTIDSSPYPSGMNNNNARTESPEEIMRRARLRKFNKD